jgi:hypothetical protein
MWTNPEIPVRIPLFFQNKNIKRSIECIDFEDFNQEKLKGLLKYQEEVLIHFIHVQEGPNTTLFGP